MLQNTERGLDSMQNGCKLQWIFSNLPGLLALSFSIGTVKSLQSVFKLKPAYYFSTKRETSHFLSSLVTVLEQVLWSYLVRRNTTHNVYYTHTFTCHVFGFPSQNKICNFYLNRNSIISILSTQDIIWQSLPPEPAPLLFYGIVNEHTAAAAGVWARKTNLK